MFTSRLSAYKHVFSYTTQYPIKQALDFRNFLLISWPCACRLVEKNVYIAKLSEEIFKLMT